MSEEHLMGPFVGLLRICKELGKLHYPEQLLEHTVATVRTEMIVASLCCSRGKRGHCGSQHRPTLDIIVAIETIVAFVVLSSKSDVSAPFL